MASIFDKDPVDLSPRKKDEPSRSKERKSLTPSEYRSASRSLYEMVTGAFETLELAMNSADFPTAVKAAQIILDRTGFGPKSTVDVNTTAIDLTSLSEEQLAERAKRVVHMLQQKKSSAVTGVEPGTTIN